MNDHSGESLVEHENPFPWLTDHLPTNRKHVGAWQKNLMAEVEKERSKVSKKKPSKAVKALERLIEKDPIIRMYVNEMIKEAANRYHDKTRSIHQMLHTLNHITHHAPRWNPDPSKRNFFPMSSLFVNRKFVPFRIQKIPGLSSRPTTGRFTTSRGMCRSMIGSGSRASPTRWSICSMESTSGILSAATCFNRSSAGRIITGGERR